jgi:type I restriction enzyme S subunit
MGKLVPQDGDDSVSAVLARLESSGGNSKIRRSVPTDVCRSNVVDENNLPDSWAIESIARLLHLGAILDLKDGNHGANHPKVSEFTDEGLPFITAAQVSDEGIIDYAGAYKLSGAPLERLRVGFAKSGDVIYTHKGSVGRVAICSQKCVLSPQTTYYRLNPEVFSPRFVLIVLKSPFFRRQVDEVKRQTTRDFVSINAQYQFFLRVAPIAEQHRIVAKVDELMALCDALKARIKNAQINQVYLADVIVEQAVA